MGTYRAGIATVIAFVFALFIAVSLLDLVCEFKNWPSIGYRVHGWSRRHPWFVAVLLLGLATLLTHFFGHSIR